MPRLGSLNLFASLVGAVVKAPLCQSLNLNGQNASKLLNAGGKIQKALALMEEMQEVAKFYVRFVL